jgi:ACS family tartrate transporter-like MFS transporter
LAEAVVYPAAQDAGFLERALKRARWRLLPLLSLGYIAAYIDRVNISFAQEPMSRALGLTAETYGLGAGLFFLTYAACEIPSNALLLRFGARRWLARIMLTWGVMAMAMATVHTPSSFYTMRMLLGVAEAGYFPGVIFYLSLWFPARERARVNSLFYMALPLTNVVMGGAAGALLRLNGRLHLAGWQWLFLVEGMPAVLISGAMWWLLPDGPGDASWMPADERAALVAAMNAEHDAVDGHGAGGWRLAVASPKIWWLGLFYFFMLGSFYGLSFSLPVMLKGATGWAIGEVGTLVVLIGVAGAVAMVANGVHSDARAERRWHIVIPVLLMGAAMLVAGALGLRGWTAAIALCAAMVIYSSFQGPLLTIPTSLFSGEACAVGIATMNMCGIVGGFVFPYFMGWMRVRTGGYAWGVALLAIASVASAGIMLRLLGPAGEPAGAVS